MQVKFYLGQSENCSLRDSASESSEKLPQRGRRAQHTYNFGEEGIHAVKHIFFQKISISLVNFASHKEQSSPWRILVLNEEIQELDS